MKKASEYREHAKECRTLASHMEFGEQRDQLLTMAVQWERMATERADLVRRHPEVGEIGEQAEERQKARN